MSIVIIAMSKTTACVASDSRMIGNFTSERFAKIFTYSDQLCMYGVGNAGITSGLFTYLNHLKNTKHAHLGYTEAVKLLFEWKEFIESTPEYNGIYGVVGVCGFENHHPESTMILIDSQDRIKHTKILSPSPQNVIDFYILSPPGLEDDLCNRQFKSSYRDTSGQPHQSHLIAAATQTIKQLAPLSTKINAEVQFWSHDLSSGNTITHTLPLISLTEDHC